MRSRLELIGSGEQQIAPALAPTENNFKEIILKKSGYVRFIPGLSREITLHSGLCRAIIQNKC